MKVEIQRIGMTPEKFDQEIKMKFITIKNGLEALGKATRDQMRFYLTDSITRDGSTGNLGKSINYYVEDFGEVFSVGVGSIPELNRQAPYWYIINYGGYTTISARGLTIYGSFNGNQPDSALKGTGVGTQRFREDGKFPMTPEFPIAAKNYIEKTTNWVSTVWKVHFFNFSGKTGVFTT